MQKECLQCGINFEITEQDLLFYKKVSPKISEKIFEVPPPKLCPDCRQQRRLAWRNERKLYQRKCDLTGKEIISNYSPEKPYKVYFYREWQKDNWNVLDYGKNFDFSQNFFEQFYQLQLNIPKKSLNLSDSMENCDYCNYGLTSKDCYMCTTPVYSEKCIYSWTPVWGQEDNDGYANIKCQYCYECMQCVNCYEVFFSIFSLNCKNSAFLSDCIGCDHCFGCINLRHKKYYFLNQKLSQTEYEKKVKEVFSSNKKLETFKKEYEKFILSSPRKFVRNTNVENCTGDVIHNSKNCYDCYDILNMENSKFCDTCGEETFGIYDCNFTGFGSMASIEVIGGGTVNQTSFCAFSDRISDSYYCFSCESCNNCFGCEGLKHKKYCILNKQYSKEEYEELVPKIIAHMQKTGEWGEFFPIEISPFAYNETVAQEYFPLTKEDVLNTRSKWWDSLSPPDKGDLGGLNTITPLAPLIRGEQSQGWRWREEEDKISDVKKIIPAERLPDKISDIPDDILNWAIKCEKTGRPFKIQKAELEFYRKMNLPIPHLHPDARHEVRMSKRNPRKLWERNCTDCGTEIQTTYSPDRPEKVLCESCYLKILN